MSISPLSTSYSTLDTSSISSRRQDFSQLATALQNGNLQGAQQAYAKLQQSQGGSSANALSPAGSSATSPIATDFVNLGKALSSGDLTAAQGAFSQLKTDLQAAQQSGAGTGATAAQGHKHHHHTVAITDPLLPDSSTISTGSGSTIPAEPFIPLGGGSGPGASATATSNPVGGTINLVG